MNELLLIIEIIVVFSMLLLSKKFFGKNGVFLWIGVASIIANIQTVKSVDMFGISATLGTVMFASNFLATDILNECYGKKEAKKGVYIGVFSIIIFLICTQLSLLFKPSVIDIAQGAMETLFTLSLRVSISSLVMYFVANILGVMIYDKLREKFKGKKMWLRNNVTTIFCNCLENFGFVFLAFVGVFPIAEVLMIAISTSIIEILIALCDTPFLYIVKKTHKEKGSDN